MSERTKSATDAFTFSLSGLRAVAGYAVATAIENDRINKAWDEKLVLEQDDQPGTAGQAGSVPGRFWLSRRHRAA